MPFFRAIFIAFSLLFLTVSLSIFPIQTASAEVEEYQVKAGFLLNFLKLTEFPVHVTEEQSSSGLKLCTSQLNGADKEFFKALDGQQIGKAQIQVIDGIQLRCDAAFLSAEASNKDIKDFVYFSTKPGKLGVVETESDFSRGGVIAFSKSGNKIRFKVNMGRMKASEVRLSSQLLRLADIVE